jgi:O-acetyl-ADP-ribose deacetylase (regulator of RNase III)
MVEYLTTSLFDSPAQTLVNPVNTVGVMGSGLAAKFKALWPAMYEDYRCLCLGGVLRIGKLYLWRSPDRWVLNFPTKRHWRHRSRLDYIEAGLQCFVRIYSPWSITSVAFPKLGCGNGGLNWEHVRPVMEQYLTDLPIPVYIHV